MYQCFELAASDALLQDLQKAAAEENKQPDILGTVGHDSNANLAALGLVAKDVSWLGPGLLCLLCWTIWQPTFMCMVAASIYAAWCMSLLAG